MKLKRFLSIFLVISILAVGIPFGMMSVSAAEPATVDYASMEAQSKLSIEDYYAKLGMHDGLGLRLADGALIVDGDWSYQLGKMDKDVAATPAYGIYDVIPGSVFTVNFAEGASKMKYYVSDNYVDWFVADASVNGKTATIAIPAYAKYIKLLWAEDGSCKVTSVNFKKRAAAANEVRINYAKNTSYVANVGNGYNDVNVLLNRGVWQSSKFCIAGTGAMQPDWGALDGATSANSYNGYATYKVQPGTAFSLTATVDSRGHIENIAKNLGYADPTDMAMEFYVSSDNVNFTKLDVKPNLSSRYSNIQAANNFNWRSDNYYDVTWHNSTRSYDYDFIVPDGAVFVKVMFPFHQNLSSAGAYGGCGNDVFGIDKVEFTALKYDYVKLSDNDYYIDGGIGSNVEVTSANFANLGIDSTHGFICRKPDGVIDTDWDGQCYNKGQEVTYAVKPGTAFWAGFKLISASNLSGSCSRDDFVFTIKGYNPATGAWENASELRIQKKSDDSYAPYYYVDVKPENNIYTKIKIAWPFKQNDSYCCQDAIGLAEVAFTADTGRKDFDYDLTSSSHITSAFSNANLADFGMSGSTEFVYSNLGLDPDWGVQNSGGSSWVTYDIKENTDFYAEFKTQDSWLGNIKGFIGIKPYVVSLQVYDNNAWQTVDTFTVSDPNSINYTYALHLAAKDNHYSKVRVLWPTKANSIAGNNCFALVGAIFTPVQKTYNFMGGWSQLSPETAKSKYGVYSLNQSKELPFYIGGNGLCFSDSNLNGQSGLPKSSLDYEVSEGQTVITNIEQNTWYSDCLFYDEGITVITSETSDFAEYTTHPFTQIGILADKDNHPLLSHEFKVPTGHKFMRVIFPQTGQAGAGKAGNDMFNLRSITFKNDAINHADAKLLSGTVTSGIEDSIFYLGESMTSSDGIKADLTFSDGSVRKVDSKCSIAGFDADKLGAQSVDVTWNGKTVGSTDVSVWCYTGDTTLDKQVNILDLIRLKKIVVGSAADVASADLSGDGDALGDDLVLLRKLLLGIQIEGSDDYFIDGSVSLEVLNNYLDHVVMANAGIMDGYPETASFNTQKFDKTVNDAINAGAKYILRAGGEWYPSYWIERRDKAAITDRIGYAHSIDPDLIFEACIFETITADDYGPKNLDIPGFVFDAFGLPRETRKFNYNAFFEKGVMVNKGVSTGDGTFEHYWVSNANICLPDITQLETQMYIYYRACTFIDMGFEAFHLGQANLMGARDTDNQCWTKVIGLIRDYAAKNARRGYVIINAHMADAIAYGTENTMLVDMIVAPTRIHAPAGSTTHAAAEGNPQVVEINNTYALGGDVLIYDQSNKPVRVSPSGWSTADYPYLVHLDNYGNGKPAGEQNLDNPNSYVWGRDEIGWFENQPESYRGTFINYIYNTIHGFEENGHYAFLLNTGSYDATQSGDITAISQLLKG